MAVENVANMMIVIRVHKVEMDFVNLMEVVVCAESQDVKKEIWEEASVSLTEEGRDAKLLLVIDPPKEVLSSV